MTKADLVKQVHQAIGPGVTRRDCNLIIEAFLQSIKEAVAGGERIEIRKFGTFTAASRQARKARNPRTGELVVVPDRRVPHFKPSWFFKDAVQPPEGGGTG